MAEFLQIEPSAEDAPPDTVSARSLTSARPSAGPRMLTCYGDEVRLPQNDLAYVGFRLAALDTLCQMDVCQGSGEDDIAGYLAEVPLLEQAAPAVQVDLLADVWRRHRADTRHEASLLDAAVVYAAFCTAGRVIDDEFKLARAW